MPPCVSFDWCHFLLPTKAKLLLAALLFFIFVPFITYDNGIRCFKAPCPASDTGSLFSWLVPRNWSNYTFMLFGQRQSIPMPVHIYSLDLPLALVGIPLSYFASCLPVFLFQKFNKKK